MIMVLAPHRKKSEVTKTRPAGDETAGEELTEAETA